MDIQFYPTPKALAAKAWGMFEDKDFERVLEPSAGEGHLISAFYDLFPRSHFRVDIDAVELDVSKHGNLADLERVSIVGTDFLDFTEGAYYSHIIMNPPFAFGSEHVLHAWDILYEGEIVAILNAETVRNPFSKERKRLVGLIEEYGRMEFVGEAFSSSESPDVERTAEVEVVLVHLKKPDMSDAYSADIANRVLDGLQVDKEGDRLGSAHVDFGGSEVTLPTGFVEDAVLRFNAAVEAMKEGVIAQARAAKYALRLADRFDEKGRYAFGDAPTAASVRNDWHKGYSKLKSTAWNALLRTTQVQNKLSSEAEKRLQAEFQRVANLSFTESNIYGFLQGLHDSSWEIQLGMMCDVFDLVTRYSSDNTVYYMGWKSNDKHVTQARRMKTTRFILPGFECPSHRSTFSHHDVRRLADMDKVFAMLDGKSTPDSSLVDAFCKPTTCSLLKDAERVSTSYFDVRFYKGIGTVHFFPTRKDLVERLNRMVGQQRQWLPDEPSQVADAFWKQYEDAEKFDKELRKTFEAEASKETSSWRRPSFRDLDEAYTSERAESAREIIQAALKETLSARGIDIETMLLPKREAMPALQAPAQPVAEANAEDTADHRTEVNAAEQLALI